MVINDLHVPFHDEAALAVVLQILKEVQPDLLVLNGDITDWAPISRFDKRPSDVLTLQDELSATKKILKDFRNLLPNTKFIFIPGNHEDRLQKWLNSHPEVSTLECLSLKNLLDLNGIDCALVSNGVYMFHDYLITHGDLIRSHAGNTAHAMIQKWGHSGISGHTHRLAQVQKRNYFREFTWIENGCLAKLTPNYMTAPDWQHGFSLLTFYEDRVWPQCIPIKNGEARFDNIVFPTLFR